MVKYTMANHSSMVSNGYWSIVAQLVNHPLKLDAVLPSCENWLADLSRRTLSIDLVGESCRCVCRCCSISIVTGTVFCPSGCGRAIIVVAVVWCFGHCIFFPVYAAVVVFRYCLLSLFFPCCAVSLCPWRISSTEEAAKRQWLLCGRFGQNQSRRDQWPGTWISLGKQAKRRQKATNVQHLLLNVILLLPSCCIY